MLLSLKKTTSNYVLCSLCLVLLFLITGCSQTDSEDNSDSCTSAGATASSKLPSLNGYLTALNLSTDLNTIYTIDYQENVAGQIAGLKSENDYTAENPLLISNPYGTNTTSLYIYFHTDTPALASYCVTADGYEDYSRTLCASARTEHEYLLTGIIPDTDNQITLTLRDESGRQTDKIDFSYDAPALKGSADNIQLKVTKGDSSAALSEGLYAMLGNRTEEDNTQVDFILLYDNYGTLRSEIPIKSYRTCNILFGDDGICFSISSSELAVMNPLGQVTEIYETGDYHLHHDYIWGTQNDILALASEEGCITEEDRIISIDRDTRKVTEVLDLADLFQDYLDTLDIEEDSEEAFDWIHINSIRTMGDDSIIISSRETSSIIKIDHIYSEPEIDYIIGSSHFWEESGYDDLVLTQEGDFSLNAGQHCVEIEYADELENGQYYLYFFNNNNAVSSTRDYNYADDSGYEGTFSGVEGDHSYYDKYLVDENTRTFSLTERIPVTYSGYVSSVQHLENNLLVDSGSAFTAAEYDSDHNLIQTLTGTGDTWWYRVFKLNEEDLFPSN